MLEPIFEVDFEPCSYGFRPGRRAWDAIAEVRYFSSRSYEWIVEADIEACFDELSHSAITDRMRRRIADKRVLALIKAFLKAGILTEQGSLERTITGTPQGGILSPLMANVALSVLDEHYARAWEVMGQKWHQRDAIRKRGGATYRLIRYADDFVICVAGERRHAEELIVQTEQVIAPLGLKLSPEKTRVVHIDEGIDFLGWRIKRQRRGSDGRRYVYTYPSKRSLMAVKAKVREITRSGHNQTLAQLLHRLNPVLRGWCAYFRCGVSSQTFAYLDAFAWRRVVCWLRRKYPKTKLALAARPPPSRMVADRRQRDALPPREGGDNPLPLPRREDHHAMGSRPDRYTRPGLRARAPGEPDCLTPPACLWRARCGGSRTPGSVDGSRKRADPKGRWRASIRPYYYALEDCFELLLVNAAHAKNVPGRKTDTNDAQWLCQLLECGLLRASFVPPKPIRALRDLTRYRKSLIQERAREINRLHKVLEDAGIKLSSVATDVLGVSGRQILEALLSGTRDPELLAELAKGRLRAKLPELQRALAGDFQAQHALILSQLLAHLDYLEEMIATLTAEIEQRLVAFARKAELLTTIHGVSERTSHVIIAELGPDMTRFTSDRHAASWAAICPGNNEAAGKRSSGKTRKGNPYLRTALTEAANGAARTKNTYLRAQYEHVKRRRGHKKAIVAVAHSILIASYHILKDDVPYHDLGGDYFARRADPARITKRLVAQLERLGHTVTLQTSTDPEPLAA